MSSLLTIILIFVIFYLIVLKEEPKVIYIEKKRKDRERDSRKTRYADPAFFMRGGRLKPMDAISGRRMTH